eukprot:CAMPEP_0204823348 /NCGR_PEP_ID=MMETSP1346-20131115/1385_1 /ASSEMBLY_ACC=CAM_ASM_000771 /TAXON_ID=215587 /ORGANISM="Aplanochytrium stocchinoi, Strain GSBS06" /LENGTH=195 /DNA_ID=CAMNT_0051949931 /DNA_START=481 /DNA_END=1068 /DNA_ORIENTATION=+
MIAAIVASLAFLILAGYFTTIPLAGEYFSELGFQFEVQVFNECCVGLDSNNTVNVCGEPSNQLPVCFDADKKWSDLVSEELCEALENIEADSFVGNSSCGGGDAATFIDDFAPFVEKNINYAALSLMCFSVVLVLTWVASIFQCCAIQSSGEGNRIMRNTHDDDETSQVSIADFGGGGGKGMFLETFPRDPEEFL